MEKVENPTAIRVKNSFSIENILSRPDNSESQRKLIRQNAFQNNHVLFYNNQVNHNDNLSGLNSSNLMRSEERLKKIEVQEDVTDNEDHETNSEAASDDGNSSVHSECHEAQIILSA
jgi:hypothetical protein